MRFWKGLKIRSKLLLVVAFPLALIIVLAGLFSLDQLQTIRTVRDIHHLAQATELLDVVHRLQYERGRAFVFLYQPDASTRQSWQQAAERSDVAISALTRLQEELARDHALPDILQALGNVESELSKLQSIREQMVNPNTPGPRKILNEYSNLIDYTQRKVSSLESLIPYSELIKLILVDSLIKVGQLKELLFQQHILIDMAARSGQILPGQQQEMIRLQAMKKLLSEQIQATIPEEQRSGFLRLVDEAELNFSNVADRFISSPQEYPMSDDTEQWLGSISDRINYLRNIEIELADGITELADESRGTASLLVGVALGVAVLSVLLVAVTTLIASSRIAKGFTRLRDAAVEFTETGELKQASIDSHDELGEIGRAFNALIDQLQQVSLAVEAVANGDFTQKVQVKSDNDRLAKSLNHMIRTLHDSVQNMQAENWVKTGLNELSAHTGSDQTTEALIESSLNFLAGYIKAPVGAIYLVDDAGVAQMCSSYAYARRKGIQHSFSENESLVGQAVKEQKPFIIENLPSDYITISSGLGHANPENLVLLPMIYDDQAIAVLELATLHQITELEFDFLRKACSGLVMSIHAALSRKRLTGLLEETRAQSEELQAQQEEMEQANNELEEQARELESSKQALQNQQKKLIDANDELREKSAQLSKRNKEIETRSAELEQVHRSLEIKAAELEASSRYKSEFMANMSHELRTPLNSLLLLAQTLRENEEGNLLDDQIDALDVIQSSGKDLLSLINDILDLSKIEAGKMLVSKEPCDIRQVVHQLKKQFSPLAEAKSLDFSVEVDSDVPSLLYIDVGRLQQILRNLLGNAIKFTDEGTVSLVVSRPQSGGIQFDVEDSGIGIPEELQKAVFEAFQQGDGSTRRKYSGTGLGLTISRELTHILGGDLQLKSTDKKGCTFTALFPESVLGMEDYPSKNSAKKQQSAEDQSGDSETGGRRESKDDGLISDDRYQLTSEKSLLLVIEDDQVLAEALLELAHERYYQCIVAKDIASGIKCAETYRPKAIILDKTLAGDADTEISSIFSKNALIRDIPVHVLSGHDGGGALDDAGLKSKLLGTGALKHAFSDIQPRLADEERVRLLVVEDDDATRHSIEKLLKKQNDLMDIVSAATGTEAMNILEKTKISGMILDLNLPDIDSMDILVKVSGPDVKSPVPVIIYTGKDLGHEEYRNLRQYTDNIIIKGSQAQERLLNDVRLFLHSIKGKGDHAPHSPEPSIGNQVLKGKKVLLVDDDMRNVYALSKLLRRYGLKVEIADNGETALQRLNALDDVDLAIMDIMMPVMDGYEAIQRIRQHPDYKDLPIITLTAKAMPEDRDKCLQAGANDYIAKPVDPDRLLSAMKVWINS